MSILTDLKARRVLYLAAEQAILGGQEYRIRDGVIDRQLRRADLDMVTATLASLDRQITSLESTRRIMYLR